MRGELLTGWSLPTALTVGGQEIPIRADFRQVLAVLQCLEDEELPLFARWRKALRLFYGQPIQPEQREEAMEQLCGFISCYQKSEPGPRLMSWTHDAQLIAAQVNQVAGQEVRQAAFALVDLFGLLSCHWPRPVFSGGCHSGKTADGNAA